MLAAIPIATELKTIYFSTGEATEVNRLEGHALFVPHRHRHLLDCRRQHALGVDNLGKIWTIIYADYAWGQSTYQESKLFIEKPGGKVLASISGAARHQGLRALSRADSRGHEVVLPAFIGSLSVAFYTQAKSMGLDKKMKMFSSSAPWRRLSRRHSGRRRRRLLLRELPARAQSQGRRIPPGIQRAHGHRRRLRPRNQRHTA